MSKFIATFKPEALVLGSGMDVDPLGPIAWDTTEHIQAGCESLYLAGPSNLTDSLRDFKEAPAWVRDWSGPFSVLVEKMDDDDADAYLAKYCESGGPVPLGSSELPCFAQAIPDSDGVFGRAFRHALESIVLAMQGEGIDRKTIARVAATTLDAYGNNVEAFKGEHEIDDMLVVSIGHLLPSERTAIVEGDFETPSGPMLSMSRPYGGLIFIQKPDNPDDKAAFDNALRAKSAGFRGIIARCIELGASWVMFDRDANAVPGIPTYDDLGNIEDV